MNGKTKFPTNNYGNIDVRLGVLQGFSHMRGKRLTVTCKAIGVECAPALVDWESGKWGGPVFDGVVVRTEDEAKLREAIARRNANRLTPAEKAERKRKAQEQAAQEFAVTLRERFPFMPEADVKVCAAHATEIGSGRVGRSTTCEDPIRAAVVAYVRHNYTSYDDNLASGYDRDDARAEVGGKVREVILAWEGVENIFSKIEK